MRPSIIALAVLGGLMAAAEAATSAGSATLLDLNDVLDQSIDDVEDAPEFVIPPAGAYLLHVADAKVEKYKVNDKDTHEEEERTRIRLVYAVDSTRELASAEELPVAPNSLFSEQFMTNPQGLSYFKRQANNILGEEVIKGAKIGDILNELRKGELHFAATVKVKKTTANGKTYENVQVRIKPNSDALSSADVSVQTS